MTADATWSLYLFGLAWALLCVVAGGLAMDTLLRSAAPAPAPHRDEAAPSSAVSPR